MAIRRIKNGFKLTGKDANEFLRLSRAGGNANEPSTTASASSRGEAGTRDAVDLSREPGSRPTDTSSEKQP